MPSFSIGKPFPAKVMVPFLCFALWLGADSARGQSLIEDSRIKTWTYPLSGWNMESGASFYADIQLPSAIKATKILGLQVLVLSDEAFPEVFNLTRLSGKLGATNIGRSGGRSNFFIYDDGKLFVTFERGECQVDLTGTCQTGTNPKTGGPWQTGFFANGKHDGAPEQTYPNRIQRSFYNAGKTRLVLKIQYDCASNCGGTATNKFWKQIGTWDMKTQGAKTYPENTFGIHPSRLVDLNAAIHSDPNSGNKIQVDNLEHLGTRIGSYPINRGRGGILWYGYGLWRGGGVPSNQYALRLHQGPNTEGTSSANVVTSYRSTYYMPDPNSQVGLKYTDGAASGRNRGWIMLEYTGAKSAVKIPYLFLSRAYPIPPWNMMESDESGRFREIPLSSFGVSANRIARITSTIISDHSDCLPKCQPGHQVNNFHRPHVGSGGAGAGSPITREDVGGLTYVDENLGTSGKVIIAEHGITPLSGFYSEENYFAKYTNATVDRGYVLMDYLAGSCAQGGSGFTIAGIPSGRTEQCDGTGNLVVEGSGRNIDASSDDFVFVQKPATGATRTLIIKVASQKVGYVTPMSGIMFRASLNANAKFVAVLVNPAGGGSVRYRKLDGEYAGQIAFTSNATPWLKLEMTSGPTFTAYYANTSGTPTNADWRRIGVITSYNFPTGSYYVGTASMAANTLPLHKTTFSNLSGF